MQNSPVNHPDCFFIDGAWVRPATDSRISVINPATEELCVAVAEAQAADVSRAVSAAREAFDRGPWPRMSPVERACYLSAAAGVMARRMPEATRNWTSEMGIVHTQAQAMVNGLPGALRFYAGLANSYPFIEAHQGQDPTRNAYIVREPVGVAALIVPWNAALHLIVYKAAPALLAGCTVIVKNSPESPLDGYLMAEIMQEIGLPKGVFNMITADREVSELLVRHEGVDKVSFTGSTAAGKKIGSICGERVARCTLELGGKSAAVVLDDYDLAKVAEALTGSTCFISNQVCSALSRIVIPRKRHDGMVDALSSAFRAIRVGDPFAQESQMGPLAMSRQRDRVEHYIAKGVEEGATLATGGKRPRDLEKGYFIEPTVFGGVDPGAVIAQEEIFGPVVTIIPAKDEEQAIEIANGTPYGLNSAVFTDDVQRAHQVGRRLRAGTVGHNSFQTDFTVSFGGFKQSGIGREGGKEGLLPFLETKTMMFEGTPDFTADRAASTRGKNI
jgi:acyl-CoA reductase-like NAD-dependent aldehyde dehydrogenase